MKIRNIAIAGVDTLEKYKKCCKIVSDGSENITQFDIDNYFSEGANILFDSGSPTSRFYYWVKSRPSMKNCTLYTYEEFLEKFEDSDNAESKHIAMFYEAGTLGSFETALMDLIGKADLDNREKLANAYPEYYKAYQIWYKGEYK